MLLGLLVQAAIASPALAKPTLAPQRFVVIPKTDHPWFDKVRKGARAAAVMIEAQTGGKASIDYRAPSHADPSATAFRPLLQKAHQQGIAVNVFDSEPPTQSS